MIGFRTTVYPDEGSGRPLVRTERTPLISKHQPGPEEAERWNGTLLKCPGCRLKFPFSARDHGLTWRTFPPFRNPDGEPRSVLVTNCPRCDGWVTVS